MTEEISSSEESSVELKHSVREVSCRNFFKNITVEVPLLLGFFSYSLTEALFANQILYRTCTITLGYDKHNCSLLGTHNESEAVKNLETLVQPYTSIILMAKQLIEGIFPTALSLFLGPWSDVHGRKPLIVASALGTILCYTLWFIYCQLEWLSPWYLIVTSIPSSLMGGMLSIITGTFCYISDITTTENRSARITFLEAAMFVGLICGSLLSSVLYNALGYSYVIIIACILSIISLMYTIFLIKESLENAESGGLCSVFDLKLVRDMMTTCTKPRRNYNRIIIWLCMFACAINMFVMMGASTVSYLFVRKALQWNIQDYTMFNAFSIVTGVVGILISMVVFQNWLKFSDAIMAMVSYASVIVEATIKAFATVSWEMYLAASVSFLRGVASPLTRSILSKVVPKDDVGKIYSFTTVLESIIPQAAPTLYSLLYNATFTTYPGSFFFVTVAACTICMVLQGFVVYLLRKYPPEEDYQPLLINE